MTATQTNPTLSQRNAARGVVRLENGDCLTRAEFERRWQALPQLKFAELINGVVYMPSPTRAREHSTPHSNMIGLLTYYKSKTPRLGVLATPSARLDEDNMPQPDVVLRTPRSAGGLSRISDDGYLEGPAELFVEVSASTVSIDMHAKLDVYRRQGVPEYVVWRVLDEAIDWFRLSEGRYVAMAAAKSPSGRDVIKSVIYPGLWLDAPAMLAGDLAQVFKTVDEGIATDAAAHAALLERLKAAATGD